MRFVAHQQLPLVVFTKVVIGFLCAYIFFLVGCSTSVTAAETRNYTIGDVALQYQLHPDGSMSVEERRTFSFRGAFTFAYQTINTTIDRVRYQGREEGYTIQHIQVCEESIATGASLGCYRQLTPQEMENADEVRPPRTFYARDEEIHWYIKWFYRAETKASVLCCVMTYHMPSHCKKTQQSGTGSWLVQIGTTVTHTSRQRWSGRWAPQMQNHRLGRTDQQEVW
jgi:hypothetical protein